MPAFPPGSAASDAIQTLTAEFPASWDYWAFRFNMTNLLLTSIQEMRVLVNSAIIVRISGAVWDVVNQLDNMPSYGLGGAGSKTLIWNWQRMAITGGAQALSAGGAGGLPVLASGSSKDMSLFSTLNCGSFDANGVGIGSLRVEFDLVGCLTANIGAPSIQCKALASSLTPGGPGYIRRMEYQTPQVAANTTYQAGKNALLFGDTKHRLLNRLHLVPAAGTLDNFILRHNGVQKIQRSSAENDAVINEVFIKTSQSANAVTPVWTLDYTERTWGDEMLPIGDPGTDLQVQFTPSAAGNVNVYEDSMGAL